MLPPTGNKMLNPDSNSYVTLVGVKKVPFRWESDQGEIQLTDQLKKYLDTLPPETRLKLINEESYGNGIMGGLAGYCVAWSNLCLLPLNEFKRSEMRSRLEHLVDKFEPGRATVIVASVPEIRRVIKRLGMHDVSMEHLSAVQLETQAAKASRPTSAYYRELPYLMEQPRMIDLGVAK